MTGEESPRRERKVVTVLFCDLVGFTSQADEMDPEDVASLLDPYHARVREELERHGGTVEKFIGDAVMALFGAPVAHEDDPERAVRAALAIQDYAQEEGVELRIGITTGEALVTLGARPDQGEAMATGDVVNTAARLQAAASANGILVSEKAFEATKDAIEYAATEPVVAKGKARPVPAWQALRARARAEVERVHDAPLVGRVRELDLLTDALARVRQESSVQLVTLIGVPGIGKSRLVFELFRAVGADPELITWRHGRCLPYGDGVTFWALGEMVKAEAGILETDSEAEAQLKLTRAVGDEWVRSKLRPLVGLATEETDVTRDRRSETFAAWRRFFEALAEPRPAVLVFEDVHWADDAMLDFVDHLVEWAMGVPLLVVCTGRPELLARRPDWGGGKPNALTISLAQLSDAETARLIAELLRQPLLDAAQQSAVVLRAEGNPLYAEQFVRMLRERGGGDELEVPETVQGIIAARLDGLTSDEKSLLQDASVLGKTFPLSGLAAVSGIEAGAVEVCLHTLERKEFVRRERRAGSEETNYAFRHILVRDVAYGQIPRLGRLARHRRSAEWIESVERPEDYVELLAHHYLSALEFAEASGEDVIPFAERACRALAGAGDRASELSAFTAAARFYERALELSQADDPDRPLLLLRYGCALRWGRDTGEEVLAEAREGLLAMDERAAAAEADVLLADLFRNRGEPAKANEHFDSARSLVLQAEPSRPKAYVLAELARFSMLGGDPTAAIETGREALAIAEELRLDDIRSHALNTVGTARVRSNDPGGLADVELSLELALQVNSALHALRAYNNLIAAVGWSGDLRRERALWREALAAAERFGEPGLASGLQGNRPSMLYEAGDWDEAVRVADAYIAQPELRQVLQEAGCRTIRAEIRFARGDVEGALDDMATALEQMRQIGAAEHLNSLLCDLAALQLELGNVEATARLADEAAGIAAGRNAAGLEFLSAALVFVALGRADELLGWLESRPPTRWVEAVRHVADGRLDRAADVYAEMGAMPSEALARLRAAEQFVAEGRRAEADVQLQRALAFYRSVGATRYVREGEALLAAAS